MYTYIIWRLNIQEYQENIYLVIVSNGICGLLKLSISLYEADGSSIL